MRLLASHYRRQERLELTGKDGFLSTCVKNCDKQPFLLDMVRACYLGILIHTRITFRVLNRLLNRSQLPYILPEAKSPNGIMNCQKEAMILTLRYSLGLPADIQLVGALANIAAALKKSALLHHEESRDLESLSSDFEDVLVESMNSPSMDSPDNVTRVLCRFDTLGDEKVPEVVQKAYAIQSGPLRRCADLNLTKVFATAQIIRHVEEVFYGSLKPKRVVMVKSPIDLFQLRTECSTIRFRPVLLFLFEGLLKLITLGLVIWMLTTRDLSKEFLIRKCCWDSVGIFWIFGCYNINTPLDCWVVFTYMTAETTSICRWLLLTVLVGIP